MRKELEALLLSAAKAIGYGVVGVDHARAAEFGVRVGVLVREGELPPGGRKAVKLTGYYCKTGDGQPTPERCLVIDANRPGDGWTRYTLAELRQDSTGHYSFGGSACLRNYSEMCNYLRGIIDGAELNQ